MSRAVILVAGPPCSGKTTYVAQRAKPGDLVLDQDVIGTQAMRRGLASLPGITGTAWVIRCCPGPRRRAAFARQIGATDTVLLTASEPELIARAAHRPNPRRHIQAVRDWLAREALDAPGRSTSGARKPGPARTTTERGYGWEHQKARAEAIKELRRVGVDLCPYCGGDMTAAMELDYDHYPPLAVAGPGGPRRLSHSSCNRRAGQALGIARRTQRAPTQPVVNSRAW